MKNKYHTAEFWIEEHKKHPPRILPIVILLLGIMSIAIAPVWILICDNIFGTSLAIFMISFGSLYLFVSVRAILTTKHNQPFGANASDRAIAKHWLLIVGLFVGFIIFLLFVFLGTILWLGMSS